MQEFRSGLRRLEMNELSPEDVRDLWRSIDEDRSGFIDYYEFCLAFYPEHEFEFTRSLTEDSSCHATDGRSRRKGAPRAPLRPAHVLGHIARNMRKSSVQSGGGGGGGAATGGGACTIGGGGGGGGGGRGSESPITTAGIPRRRPTAREHQHDAAATLGAPSHPHGLAERLTALEHALREHAALLQSATTASRAVVKPSASTTSSPTATAAQSARPNLSSLLFMSPMEA